MSDQRLIKRPKWYRLFARRRWEQMFGTAKLALVDTPDVKQIRTERELKRSMKGVVGA